ncbi:MAG: aldo/keto reductase, partial [Planctomycetota bacterium]
EQMDSLMDAVEAIRQRLDGEMETIFDADWAQNYLKGVPDWSQTPEGLNVFIVVWLWNLVKAFDLKKYAQMRYNLMGNAEHWFPGCKPEVHAKIDRKALRQSLDASPYADRMMDILEEAYDLMKAEEVNRLSQDE